MQEMVNKILDNLDNPLWWTSQAFAFVALVAFVWGWQIKNKVRMMILIGIASLALAASAPFLGNYSLAVLFGLAAIRNFVFAYIDWRALNGMDAKVKKTLTYSFAGVFAVCTIVASVLFMTLWPDKCHSWWLELCICITLLGLILGNILKGTHLMRLSFVSNRVFNIINHIHFINLIAIIIAALSIGSNLVFYLRMLISYIKKRGQTGQPQEVCANADEQAAGGQAAETIAATALESGAAAE